MAKKSKVKSFKKYGKSTHPDVDADTAIQYVSDSKLHEREGHPYKMTYSKVTSDGKGGIVHHYHHVTHHLEGNPQTREGARGMVSRTQKHQELKEKGYKPHTVGHHDKDRTHSMGAPIKHTEE